MLKLSLWHEIRQRPVEASFALFPTHGTFLGFWFWLSASRGNGYVRQSADQLSRIAELEKELQLAAETAAKVRLISHVTHSPVSSNMADSPTKWAFIWGKQMKLMEDFPASHDQVVTLHIFTGKKWFMRFIHLTGKSGFD